MGERAALTKTPQKKAKESISTKPMENLSQSMDSPVEQILHLQRTIGNQAVQRLINSGTLQAKLKIGQPNDKYEQEADHVAEKVMRMPEPDGIQRKSTCPECEEKEEIQTKPLSDQIMPLVQRQENEEEEEPVQAKQAGSQTSAVTSNIESGVNSLKGGGQPLTESTRAYFEPRFGTDFSRVRVHTGSNASEAAMSINAKAFTTGSDVVFGSGQYSPGTSTGKQLLAHELTHVVQQRQSNLAPIVHRFVPGDVTRMSITKEWAESLNDDELAEQIRLVRGQLLDTEPGTPEHESARSNLQILDAEVKRRPRSIGELAEPPLPTATIILVGSPTDPNNGYDKSPYNYTNAALAVMSKIQDVLPGTRVTILFFSPGYKLRGENVYNKALQDLNAAGANVIEVINADGVINYLNFGLVSPSESIPTRAIKVSRFFYFGHGSSGDMLLNWGWGQEPHSIGINDISNIKTDAFEPMGESYLFTCHIAEGTNSFISIWASHLGQTSIGPQGNAAFNAKYEAHDLEKAINEKLPEWFLGLPYMNQVKIIDPKSTE